MEGMEVVKGMKASELAEKTCLVTGGAGFIGSSLVRRLLAVGADVTVFVKETTMLDRLTDISEEVTLVKGDLSDYSSVSRLVSKLSPEFIFHLAAFRDVSRDPSLLTEMVDININGTVNLLRAAAEDAPTLISFVNTGTCEEYGDGPVPFSEDQREIPVSPYSASKVASTYICQMMSKSTGLPVVTLRPFLTYGPGQDTDMFIPSLIAHCLSGNDFSMTSGDQTREFNFIDDVVDAYLLAATAKDVSGEVINIGCGVEYKISELAVKIVEMTGSEISLKAGSIPKRPGEAKNFFCDNSKAKRLLGWSPRVALDAGLEITVKWYRRQKTN